MNNFYGKKEKNITGLIIIGFIVLLVVGTVFAGRFFKDEEKIRVTFKNGETIPFLVLGTNSQNEICGAFVAFFQTKNNRSGIVSILPKTYLSFGDNGFFTLEEALVKKNNYEAVTEAVSNLIGYPINYYVSINKDNFIKLIDLINGVEIYTEEIILPELNVNIPSGLVLLDGDKAVEYLSFLNEEEIQHEYKQLNRIQDFAAGFMRLKDDFINQFNEKVIANVIYKLLDTNLKVNELVILYYEIKEKFNNGTKDFSIGLKANHVFCDKKKVTGYDYVYLPKKTGTWIKSEVADLVEIIEKNYGEKEIGNIVIEILNGTDIVGMAARARNYLIGYGFDVIDIGNANTTDYQNTVIINFNSDLKAKKLSDLLQCDRVVNREDNADEDKVDLRLILGMDFDGKIVR
jgi:polyisoprenyl-teichoic acid--peptidoglycan teichoic acid transferase